MAELTISMVGYECCQLLAEALGRVPVRCRYSSGPPLPGFRRFGVQVPVDLALCMDDLSRSITEPIERLAASIAGAVEWDSEAVFHRLGPSTLIPSVSVVDPQRGLSLTINRLRRVEDFADSLSILTAIDVVPLPWRAVHRERNLRILQSYEAANA